MGRKRTSESSVGLDRRVTNLAWPKNEETRPITLRFVQAQNPLCVIFQITFLSFAETLKANNSVRLFYLLSNQEIESLSRNVNFHVSSILRQSVSSVGKQILLMDRLFGHYAYGEERGKQEKAKQVQRDQKGWSFPCSDSVRTYQQLIDRVPDEENESGIRMKLPRKSRITRDVFAQKEMTNKNCRTSTATSSLVPKKTILSCKMLAASIRQALQVLMQANKHADLHPEITLPVLPEPPPKEQTARFPDP